MRAARLVSRGKIVSVSHTQLTQYTYIHREPKPSNIYICMYKIQVLTLRPA